MKKTILAISMAYMIAGAGAAYAAPGAGNTQGAGQVTFQGTVVDAPCGISPDSIDQTVDFGPVSKALLDANGTSVVKPLDIKLVNCTFAAATGGKQPAKKVKVAFNGTTVTGQAKELGTSGGTGTAIVVSGQNGTSVSFDGSDGVEQPINTGSNSLHYSAWVKKATGSTSVTEGAFSAVANFTLTYL